MKLTLIIIEIMIYNSVARKPDQKPYTLPPIKFTYSNAQNFPSPNQRIIQVPSSLKVMSRDQNEKSKVPQCPYIPKYISKLPSPDIKDKGVISISDEILKQQIKEGIDSGIYDHNNQACTEDMLLTGYKKLIKNLNTVFKEKARNILSIIPKFAIDFLEKLVDKFWESWENLKSKITGGSSNQVIDSKDDQQKYITTKLDNSLINCLKKTENKLKLKKRIMKRNSQSSLVATFAYFCADFIFHEISLLGSTLLVITFILIAYFISSYFILLSAPFLAALVKVAILGKNPLY